MCLTFFEFSFRFFFAILFGNVVIDKKKLALATSSVGPSPGSENQKQTNAGTTGLAAVGSILEKDIHGTVSSAELQSPPGGREALTFVLNSEMI